MSGEQPTYEEQAEIARRVYANEQRKAQRLAQEQAKEADEVFRRMQEENPDLNFQDPKTVELIGAMHHVFMNPQAKTITEAAEKAVAAFKYINQNYVQPAPPPEPPRPTNPYHASLLQSAPSTQAYRQPQQQAQQQQQAQMSHYDKGLVEGRDRAAEYRRLRGE